MIISLDRWVSPRIRQLIEDRYYAQVTRQASFELLSRDPEFLRRPGAHVGLFADHGIVHVRDVATRILSVLETIHTAHLIPARPVDRYTNMCGFGVLLAYFHDIGMIDFSAAGRAIHPEFAAQAVFDPANEDLIELIWRENAANLSWRLTELAAQGVFKQTPKTVLREMLAVSMAHSKTKVPIAMLNEPRALRAALLEAISTDLQTLWRQHMKVQTSVPLQLVRTISADALGPEEDRPGADPVPNPPPSAARDAWQFHAARFYGDFQRDAFAWLTTTDGPLHDLAQDAIDTVRALRCADALRQRGTVLRTSAGYEIYVNGQTANAVFSLRLGADRLYLLELPGPISAGEANMASSELDPCGDLRVTFHRGAFADHDANRYAAQSAALIVLDLAADTLDSLLRTPDDKSALRRAEDLAIMVEEVGDNLEFAEMVRAEVAAFNTAAAARIQVAPSLIDATEGERKLYLSAQPVPWDRATRLDLLARMGATGHAVDGIDPALAFEHVRLAQLERNDVLIEAGTAAAFVYIPLGVGLRILPLGGYDTLLVPPWMPLGTTGVIRGAVRNASVVAEQPLQLLIIPRSTYLKHWHRTLSPDELRQTLS